MGGSCQHRLVACGDFVRPTPAIFYQIPLSGIQELTTTKGFWGLAGRSLSLGRWSAGFGLTQSTDGGTNFL
jgi:hypothetical protein